MYHNRYVRSWTTQRTISREMSQNVTGRHKINVFCEVSPTDLAHRVTSAFLWISKRVLLAPRQLYNNAGNVTKCHRMSQIREFSPPDRRSKQLFRVGEMCTNCSLAATGTKIGPDKPVVGATLVVARLRSVYIFIPRCAGRQAAWVIPQKIAALPPQPSFPRRRESIFSASPSVLERTEEPTPFSFQVVRVATLMKYSEERSDEESPISPPPGERHREGGLRKPTHQD